MAKLLVIYKTPKDKAAFNAHYADIHIPLAKKIPGLLKFEVTTGAIASPAGAHDVHFIAELEFASVAAIEAGLGSPEGQAAVGDVGNFASGGVDIFIYDTKTV